MSLLNSPSAHFIANSIADPTPASFPSNLAASNHAFFYPFRSFLRIHSAGLRHVFSPDFRLSSINSFSKSARNFGRKIPAAGRFSWRGFPPKHGPRRPGGSLGRAWSAKPPRAGFSNQIFSRHESNHTCTASASPDRRIRPAEFHPAARRVLPCLRSTSELPPPACWPPGPGWTRSLPDADRANRPAASYKCQMASLLKRGDGSGMVGHDPALGFLPLRIGRQVLDVGQ